MGNITNSNEKIDFLSHLRPKDAWDSLSLSDKATMMKVAVRNGITDLKDIRQKYNEFAEGGNLYAGAPTDDDLVDFLIKEEGFIPHPKDIGDGKITLGSGLTANKWRDLYKKRGNKWSSADNRRAVAEEVATRRRWAENNIPNWDSLPSSSQKALLAYKYNYDFTKENSPKLFKALSDSNLYEAAKQMDATSKDPKFKKGLADRRRREQNWFLSDVDMPKMATVNTPPIVEPAVNTAVFNPYINQVTYAPRPLVMVPDEGSYVKAHQMTPSEERAIKLQEKFDAIDHFNKLMGLIGIQNNPLQQFVPKTGNSTLDALSMLQNNNGYGGPIVDSAINEYRNGGGIHIKKSHRGRLTELKKRTGKTEAELYRTGSPATRKMITFARNARKWKHGLGGNLFSGEENHSQQMNIFRRPNGEYFYQASPESEEITVTPLNTMFENPALWTYTDATGKLYTPRQIATTNQGTIVKKENEGPVVEAAKNYLGELQYDINNGIPIGGKYTMPAIAAAAALPIIGEAAAPILANPYVDAGLTSAFAGHGLNHWINEGIDGWGDAAITALEMAPLSRLAKPMFNEAALAVENYRYPLGRPQVPNDYLTVKPQVRTRVGDVEIDTPNMAYRQGNDIGRTYQKYKDIDASVAQRQIEDNLDQLLSSRDGKSYISREKALDEAIANGTFDPAIGIEVDGHPAAYQDTPMYSDGFLWYGLPKIDETLPSGSLQSGLLVTPKNDSFVIGSSKATPFKGTGSGVIKSKSGITTVTDNGGRLIPADADNLGLDLNNIFSYTWEPGYGYRRVFAEETPAAEWSTGRTAIRYDLPNNDIIIESNVSATPNIPFDEAWLAASKGRHQMSNLVGSDEYAARVRQAHQDYGVPVNQADFDVVQARQAIEDSDLKVVPNLKNANGEVLNGRYDPKTRQVLVSQDRDNIQDVVESSGHEHAHASEVDRLLDLLKEKWKHIKPRKEAFTRSDGSIDTEWKDYISKLVEMRAPAMSVWSEMKELGFNKIGDYLHHLKRFGLEDKQWEALVDRYGLTNAKYMVETVFGLSPFIVNGISNEKEDNTTM